MSAIKLLEKIKKNSSIESTSVIKQSKIYDRKDLVQTDIPMLNVALFGDVDGGLTPGLTVIAGPSKHFKSAFSLIMAAAYQKKYAEGVVLFYDTEFGTPRSYFDTFGVDMDRVIHTPITDIEELKHDLMLQLNNFERGDKVCIVIDSIGNLASKKEVEDAIEGKSVADMSRAKAFKSLFRMVTPHLTIKDIPLIAVNHTYKTMEMYSKDVVGGGTGVMYSADTVWIVGRQQEKDGSEIAGYHFIINVEKSRYVKEKSKIPITVMRDGGVQKWSGMFEAAIDAGIITKPSQGWYQIGEGEKFRAKDVVNSNEFWENILENTDFKEKIKTKYAISGNPATDSGMDMENDE